MGEGEKRVAMILDRYPLLSESCSYNIINPMQQFLACARELLRSCHAPQHLLNSAPDRCDRAGFGQPWAATLRQKCLVVSRAAIPSEKNHPLAERGRPLPQVGIERA